ncbi:MAG: citrate/2-methylcitrate synthase, partial [Vulcanococcus sp.]
VVASAAGTLAGHLHGAAHEDVLAMLEALGSAELVEPWLDRAIAEKQKLMGFGHREYKVKAPRAVILQKLAEELFAAFGHDPLYDLARKLEAVAAEILRSSHTFTSTPTTAATSTSSMGRGSHSRWAAPGDIPRPSSTVVKLASRSRPELSPGLTTAGVALTVASHWMGAT